MDPALRMICVIALIAHMVLFALILVRLGESGFIDIVDDGQTYRQIAVNLLAGHGYSMTYDAPYVPDAIRVPIIPVMIAVSLYASGSILSFVFVSMLIGLAQIPLVYAIGSRLGLSRRYLVWAAVITAFEPAAFMISTLALSEAIFTTVFLCCVLLSIRAIKTNMSYANAVSLGLLLGVLSLIRPSGLYAAVVLIAWLAFVLRRSIIRPVVVMLVCTLCVAPWFMRNEAVFGVRSISSGGVQNVFFHFGSTLISFRDGISVGDATVAQYKEAVRLSGLTERQVAFQDLRLNSVLGPAAMSLIRDNPIAAIKAFVYTQVAFFTNDSYRFYYLNRLFGVTYNSSFNPTLEVLRDPVHAIPQLYEQLTHEFFLSLFGRLIAVTVSGLGILGCLVLCVQRSTRLYGVLFVLLVGYVAVTSATSGYGVTVRYKYPVYGLLVLGTMAVIQAVVLWYYGRDAKQHSS